MTDVSMVLTAASLPVTVLPLIVLMNDGDTLQRQVNGWASNLALVGIALLSVILLVAALPLQVLGGE